LALFLFSFFFFFFPQNSVALVSLDLFWSSSAKILPGKKNCLKYFFLSNFCHLVKRNCNFFWFPSHQNLKEKFYHYWSSSSGSQKYRRKKMFKFSHFHK
jgi:hypothetical protein